MSNLFAEQTRKRIEGMSHEVESCCDGGKMCGETEGVDLHPTTVESVLASRQDVYGAPEINLSAIGLHWTAILRQAFAQPEVPVIDGRLVAQMMAAVKLSRLARTPQHEDSHLDLQAYMALSRTLA